jgi:hypothetical protein
MPWGKLNVVNIPLSIVGDRFLIPQTFHFGISFHSTPKGSELAMIHLHEKIVHGANNVLFPPNNK